MKFRNIKQFIHLIIAAFFWVVFVLYWRFVLLTPMGEGTRTSLLTVAGGTGVTVVLLILWVRYNVTQDAKLPPRKHRRGAGFPEQRDFLGRKFMVKNPARLRQARYVEIDIRQSASKKQTLEQKMYRVRSDPRTKQCSIR